MLQNGSSNARSRACAASRAGARALEMGGGVGAAGPCPLGAGDAKMAISVAPAVRVEPSAVAAVGARTGGLAQRAPLLAPLSMKARCGWGRVGQNIVRKPEKASGI